MGYSIEDIEGIAKIHDGKRSGDELIAQSLGDPAATGEFC